jgi:hypothetical protein
MLRSRRTVFALRSIRQVTIFRGGSSSANRGSTTFAARVEPVQPVSRIGFILRMSTRRASPGSAPATWMGPFIGLGLLARRTLSRSLPWASMVSVTTVSPLSIRSSAGSVPRTLCQVVATKRWVAIRELRY